MEQKIDTIDNESVGFEGCEKRLLVMFEGCGDLRDIPKTKWISILKHAQCSILSTITNKECIAHLLSESSLFIFERMIMIKTCGTTTLLLIIPILIKECNASNLFYSRSDFMFPRNQPLMHRTFGAEQNYLNEHFENGNGLTLGTRDKAKWHCYHLKNAQYVEKKSKSLEIVLFDLDTECMKQYFAKNIASKSELDSSVICGCCVPSGALTDSHCFEPCGYSLNALLDSNYWTIHVTPEENASFVSFESNFNYGEYTDVITKVVEFFRPKRFGFAINSYADKNEEINVGSWQFNGFDLSESESYEFTKIHSITWSNYRKMHKPKSIWNYFRSHWKLNASLFFSEICDKL